MNTDKMKFLVLLLILLCAGPIMGIYCFQGYLEELQEQNNNLEQRITDALTTTEMLMQQRRVFKEVFNKLDNENYHVKPAQNETQFYSVIQETANAYEIEILSTRQQGVNPDGVSTMTLNLQGEYYNMLQLLAAWRDLPMTVRIANLTLRRVGQGQTALGHIAAEVTLETVFSASNTSD